MRYTLALLVLWLGLAGVAGAVSTSTAVGPAIQTSNDRWAVHFGAAPAPDGRSWEPNGPDGRVRISDPLRGTLPSGKTVDLTVGRAISAAAWKAGLKTIVKVAVPYGALAVDLWDILHDKGIERGPDGTGVIDQGQPMVNKGGNMHDYFTGKPMDPQAIASREAQRACQRAQSSGRSCEVVEAQGACSGGSCAYMARVKWLYNGTFEFMDGSNDSGPEIIIPKCTDTTSTLMILGNGGPCGSSNRIPAPDAAIDSVAESVPEGDRPGFVRKIHDNTPGGLPTDEGAPDVRGPTTVEEAPQVTTAPDGAVSTKQRKWELEYPGDGTVRFSPKVVETGPGGAVVTTKGGDAGVSPTDCDKYPNSIGCANFGAPRKDEVKKREKTVTFQEGNFGGGSCPADRAFTAFGKAYAISWTPICNATTTYVRPLVLLLGAAAAAFIFMGGLKA